MTLLTNNINLPSCCYYGTFKGNHFKIKTNNMNLVGKKVKITGNSTNHLFKIGQIVKITHCYGTSQNLSAISIDGNSVQYGIGQTDYEISFTLKDVQNEIKDMDNKLVEIKQEKQYWNDVIKYMSEINSEEFDETEFKAYQILKTIDDKTSIIEKSKLIAKILRV